MNIQELSPYVEPLARGMLERRVIKIGVPTTLKTGVESSVYVNTIELIGYPDLFHQAIEAYYSKIYTNTMSSRLVGDKTDGQRVRNHLAAVPDTGLPFAAALAFRIGDMPLLQRRKVPKAHGVSKTIEGGYSPGDEVVLVEGVLTSGGSAIAEAAIYETEGLKARGVLALVDRQQGGRENLHKKEMGLAAVMTLAGILKYGLDERIAGITQTRYDELIAELNPANL